MNCKIFLCFFFLRLLCTFRRLMNAFGPLNFWRWELITSEISCFPEFMVVRRYPKVPCISNRIQTQIKYLFLLLVITWPHSSKRSYKFLVLLKIVLMWIEGVNSILVILSLFFINYLFSLTLFDKKGVNA